MAKNINPYVEAFRHRYLSLNLASTKVCFTSKPPRECDTNIRADEPLGLYRLQASARLVVECRAHDRWLRFPFTQEAIWHGLAKSKYIAEYRFAHLSDLLLYDAGGRTSTKLELTLTKSKFGRAVISFGSIRALAWNAKLPMMSIPCSSNSKIHLIRPHCGCIVAFHIGFQRLPASNVELKVCSRWGTK